MYEYANSCIRTFPEDWLFGTEEVFRVKIFFSA